MIDLSEVVIEKNIPLPPRITNSSDGLIGILRKMEVNDSILIVDFGYRKIASSMQYVKRKNGFKFAQRVAGENKRRIWRIA